MCGIAGFAGPGGGKDALHAMASAIKRRGPDDEGFFETPKVGFAFRRLSIIDVAGGHQPLANTDGTIQVMLNGEIYGFVALREELERLGYRFATKSDTEVIVHGYAEWGDRVFEKLNGMFAIAIWDAKRSRLLLARDRLGKKPLYWTLKDRTLWFASELKALIAVDVVTRDLDLLSVGAYFRSDAVPTPRTIFQNVQKLEPATVMAWCDGKIEKTWSFWKPEMVELPSIPPRSTQAISIVPELVEGLRNRLDKAVRERLVSDVPLGLFLSGGIDSSVIAESAARQSSSKLDAFTVGFDDPSHDERPAARAVASALGIELHEETLTPDAALAVLDDAVELLDEPLADPAILPQLLLAKFTRQHVTVALTGDGGDELLLGYQHIPAHQLLNRMETDTTPIPSSQRRGVRRMTDGVVGSVARVLERVPAGSGYFSFGFKAQRLARGLSEQDPWARDLAWRGSWTKSDLKSLLLPDVAVDFADKQLADRAGEPVHHAAQGADLFWKQWSWGYLRTYLMDDVLVKVDRATMWHSLEARSPILDASVVSYLLSVPETYKLGKWKNKRLFKELVRGKIPDDVLNRPKHGFAIPTAEWLRGPAPSGAGQGPLYERLRDVSDPAFLKTQGLFDHATIERVIKEHLSGRKDRRKELWALLMFQLWYTRWMRGAG
ncbi:MAG: asparagine synthase (glutamine-hydrolyzing) [Patescibacteria group bacterium]